MANCEWEERAIARYIKTLYNGGVIKRINYRPNNNSLVGFNRL